MKKGKDRFRFKINGEQGKRFRSPISDKASMTEMRQWCEGWMKAVDKSGLPGKYNA